MPSPSSATASTEEGKGDEDGEEEAEGDDGDDDDEEAGAGDANKGDRPLLVSRSEDAIATDRQDNGHGEDDYRQENEERQIPSDSHFF